MDRGFGDYIKNLRQQKEMSLKEFAERSGLSPSEICKIETGTRTKPSPNALKAIAPVLGVTLQELLFRAGHTDDISDDPTLTQKKYIDSMGRTIEMTYLIDSIYRADIDLLPMLKELTDRLGKTDIQLIKGLFKTLSMSSVTTEEKNAILIILSKFLKA